MTSTCFSDLYPFDFPRRRTGSDHVREKDGIWAALAWLQILAVKKTNVEEVLKEFWQIYGRNFFTRYDYEGCESAPCAKMMEQLQSYVDDKSNVGKSYQSMGKTFTVSHIDNFSYTDPIDGSVSSKQVRANNAVSFQAIFF